MARTSPIPSGARTCGGRLRAPASALALLAAISCGSPAPSSGRAVTRQVVGVAGGQASAAGGRFKVQIPQGALKQDVAITIQQIDAPGAGALGPVYEVGPTGTVFQRPATLSFSFATVDTGDADPQTLHVATFSGGKWVPVTSAVDRVSSVVTGTITHLSPWTLIVTTDVVPPEPDAGPTENLDGGGDAQDGAGASDGGGAGGGAAGRDAGLSDGKAGAGGGAGGGGKGGAGAAGQTGAAGQGAAGAGGQGGGAGSPVVDAGTDAAPAGPDGGGADAPVVDDAGDAPSDVDPDAT